MRHVQRNRAYNNCKFAAAQQMCHSTTHIEWE